MDTKLLIVDDDAAICDVLKIYFENEGYAVKTANDGVEGLNFFKIYDPDIVLLDIMLPKKDGWQVCREIREMSSKPIIMITAKGEVFDKVLGLELGADDFVVKPFDMKVLFLFGSAAVGKMTVGQELMKITDLRLCHNHMTIEPVIEIFGKYDSRIIMRLREVIFE